MPSLKSIVYGLICAIVVFFIGNILTDLLDLKRTISDLSSVIGLLIPPFIEILGNNKNNTEEKAINSLIVDLDKRIDELQDSFNDLENELIEIRAILSCYPLKRLDQQISDLRTQLRILASQKKS
jgi:cell division protein ZapA (FtsZ GTPase activity inhibitor)